MAFIGETWFVAWGEMKPHCPICNGIMVMGCLFDWPPELGGEWVADEVRCNECGGHWSEEDAPKNFSTDDGQFWNVVELDENPAPDRSEAPEQG